MYLHTRPEQLLDEDKQKVLVESIYIHQPTVLDLKRIVCYIAHGVTASRGNHNILNARVVLLARISEMGRLALCAKDFEALREIIFVDSNALRHLFLSVVSVEVLKGEITMNLFLLSLDSCTLAIQHLLEACFNHSLHSDRKALSHLSDHWFDLLKSGTYDSVQDSVSSNSIVETKV